MSLSFGLLRLGGGSDPRFEQRPVAQSRRSAVEGALKISLGRQCSLLRDGEQIVAIRLLWRDVIDGKRTEEAVLATHERIRTDDAAPG